MKSERRQDLAENYLARWISSLFEKIAPYQNIIYWTILSILVVVCVGMILSRISASNRSKAWSEYLTALGTQNVEQLEGLLDVYTAGEVAARVRVSAGEIHLREGCQLIFRDRNVAQETLEKALGLFLAADSLVSKGNELVEQVAYNLAQTYEVLAIVRTDQDDLTQAKQSYEKIVKTWSEGVYTKTAEERLALLNSQAAQRFYDYYVANPQEPATVQSPIDVSIDPSEPFTMPGDLNLEERLGMPVEFELPFEQETL